MDDGQTTLFSEEEHAPPVEPFQDIMPKMGEPWPEGFAGKDPEEITELAEAAAAPPKVRVAAELVPLLKPVAKFKMHPRNLRKHDIGAIAESLKTFGIQSALVAQKSTGYICKGNGTYKAATAMGVEQLPISVEDFDDDTAYRYLLADNRASDLATYERDALLNELTKLVDGPKGLQGTLWGADDIDDLRAIVGTPEVAPEFKGGFSENPEDLAKRQQQSTTPADKMREVPIVMSLDDHARFMVNVAVLKKAYGTTGTIQTVVEAVRRESALFASHQEGAALAPTPEAVDPAPAEEGAFSSEVPPAPASPEPTEEELLERLGL